MPDDRLQRTRDAYICPLCGQHELSGVHNVRNEGAYPFCIIKMTTLNPRRLGVVRSE